MAPTIKSYGRNHKSDKSSSFDAFNKLLAKNICKRKKDGMKRRRKIQIGELPPPDKKTQLSNDSLRVDINDTFDKLRYGGIYNPVNFKDKSVHNVTTDSDTSRLKIPEISIKNTVYSPVITRSKRKRVIKLKVQPVLAPEPLPVKPKERTLDRTVDYSLEIEFVKNKPSTPESIQLDSSTSFKSLQISQTRDNNASHRPSFTNTFHQQFVLRMPPLTSTPNNLVTTSLVSNASTLASPVLPKLRNRTLLEKTYEEIRTWNHELSSMSFSAQNSSRRRRLFKPTPNKNLRRKLALTLQEVDAKLQLKSYVKLSKSLAILGIEGRVCLINEDASNEDKNLSSNDSYEAEFCGFTQDDLSIASSKLTMASELLEKSSLHHSTPRKLETIASRLEESVSSCISPKRYITLRTRTVRTSNDRKLPENKSNSKDNMSASKDLKFFNICEVILQRLPENIVETPKRRSVSDIFADSKSISPKNGTFVDVSPEKYASNIIGEVEISQNFTESSLGSISGTKIMQNQSFKPNSATETTGNDLLKSTGLHQKEISSSQSDIEVICISDDDENSQNVGKKTNKSTNNSNESADLFVAPLGCLKMARKPVLKAGKSWRRSLSLLRTSAIVLETSPQHRTRFSCRRETMCSRRMSVRIIPDVTVKSEPKSPKTQLELYAFMFGYGYDADADEGKTLEETVRKLSVSVRQSLLINETPPVTARDLILRKCGQVEPLAFSECYPSKVLQNCHKIGEGVYGEVFLYKNPKGGTTVMKVIPIEGDQIVNGDRQKKFEEIISEIVIATELSELRTNRGNTTSVFSEVQSVKCVRGRYPERLLDLWELYDEVRGSENDSPEIFSENQLFIVLELANGGKDLESYVFLNAQQTYALFQQVACALAVAENVLQFEHRDLHWGNVLITPSSRKTATFQLDGGNVEVQTHGIEACIIDFTLSRMLHDGVVIYNDLAQDEDLFDATGDYQFDIYRLMQKKNGNEWRHFEPYSNVLWLDYMLEKMIFDVRYRSKQTKSHKLYMQKLTELKNSILTYDSVKHLVTSLF